MAVPLLSPADPSNCLFCGASVTDRFRRVHGDNQNRAHRCYACDTKTRIKKGSAAGRELPYYQDPQDDPQKHHLVENLVPTDSDDQHLITDGGTVSVPNNTRHADQRWHERATDPHVGPVAAWMRAEQLVGHGLDAHEARYDAETETVLLRKNENITTVLDASRPRPSVARVLNRLGYGGEQA